MKILLLMTLLVPNLATSAVLDSMITVKGTLVRIDKDSLELETSGSKKLKIPRSVAPSLKGLITGQAELSIKLPIDMLVDANPNVFSKAN